MKSLFKNRLFISFLVLAAPLSDVSAALNTAIERKSEVKNSKKTEGTVLKLAKGAAVGAVIAVPSALVIVTPAIVAPVLAVVKEGAIVAVVKEGAIVAAKNRGAIMALVSAVLAAGAVGGPEATGATGVAGVVGLILGTICAALKSDKTVAE